MMLKLWLGKKQESFTLAITGEYVVSFVVWTTPTFLCLFRHDYVEALVFVLLYYGHRVALFFTHCCCVKFVCVCVKFFMFNGSPWPGWGPGDLLAARGCFGAIRRELPHTLLMASLQVPALVPLFCFLILRVNNSCSFLKPAHLLV